MNKTRNKILAVFCGLMIISTYFIALIYQTALAAGQDTHIWELVPEDGQLIGTTEKAYCFKVYGHVGTGITSDKNRKMIIDFKDKDGNWHTITLENMFDTGDNVKYVNTDFFPTEYKIAAGGGGNRRYKSSIAILNWVGQESGYIHEADTYWASTPEYSGNTASLTPKISNRSYISVYAQDTSNPIVEGRGDDKGNIYIEERSDVKLIAQAYGIDQYGFKNIASSQGYKLTDKSTGEKINFIESTNEYTLSGKRAYDDEEYSISTLASIGDEQAIEIQSKSFIVNNKAVTSIFRANGGTFPGGRSSQEIEQRFYHNYNLPSVNPTKAGYTFVAWKQIPITGGYINANTIFLGGASLQAEWIQDKYTITLKGVRDGLQDSSGWTNSNGDYIRTFTSSTGGTMTLPIANTDSEGHAFKGWYLVSQYGGYSTDPVSEIDLSNQRNWGNINIVAVYDTEFLPSLLLLDEGEAPNSPDSQCYVVGLGNQSITVSMKDCEELENLYEGHEFDGLTYTDKDGVVQKISKDDLKTGVTISPNFKEEVDSEGKRNYVATATAQYVPSIYTITKENEGSETSQQVTFGQSYDLGEPTRTNYEFKGWNTAADGTGLTIPTQGTVDTSFDGLKVYAQWELKNINVTYVYGYDGENTTELSLSPDQPYAFPEEANIEGTTTRWFNESGEEVSTYDNVPSGITSMTLTAKYSFPITLDYGYYGLVDNEFMVTYGDTYNLPDLSNNRVNYTFHGWYYDRFYVVYSDDIVDIKPEDNVELLGRWTKSVQLQMNESVTTIVDSFGEVEVDENDIPMYRMSSVAIDKEEIYQAVKLLLVLKHKYPNVDTSEFIDEGRGWLETLRTKIAERHHESEGLEVENLAWFIQMTADVKSENDDLWKEISSRIDRNEILKLYDVELLDIIEELNYEPSTGTVTLRVPIPENIDDYEDTVLFHYNSSKNETEYLDYEVKDGFYEVQLSSFSPVGIAANTKLVK